MSWCVEPVSLVYNMKIRRALGASTALWSERNSILLLSVLPIVFTRRRHVERPELVTDVHTHEVSGGSIFNIRYLPNPKSWLEVTTGIEKQQITVQGTQQLNAARVGLDDIVLSAGYLYNPGQRLQGAGYFLAGFPTKRSISQNDAFDSLVGTRFFGLAVGGELSYGFVTSQEKSLVGICQARFLHFFEREWESLLGCGGVIKPGNATDILFSLQQRQGLSLWEIGYNPTFFTNQAVARQGESVETKVIVRNSVYCNIAHVCNFGSQHPFLIGTGGNVSYSKTFETRTVGWWLNCTVLF